MPDGAAPVYSSFFWVVIQLIAIDLVFSLDSIITAIGMAKDIEIMIAAVVIAIIVMYFASGPVSRFIAENPTTKMLALAFLMLIGVALIADGFDVHIPRGYIYGSMAFAAAGRGVQCARAAQAQEARHHAHAVEEPEHDPASGSGSRKSVQELDRMTIGSCV